MDKSEHITSWTGFCMVISFYYFLQYTWVLENTIEVTVFNSLPSVSRFNEL